MLLKTHSFRFDEFLLETEEKVLFRDEELLPITPKVYDLLFLLVRNHGHIVEKDEIMKEVWADSFVEDSNLTYTIRQLRILLDDNARQPKYIETVPRRGYRFIAEVSETDGDSDVWQNPGQSASDGFAAYNLTDKIFSLSLPLRKNLLFGILTLFLIVAGVLLVSSLSGNEADSFENLTFKSLKTNGKFLHTAISPDGKFFAYTDETNEKMSLWLQNIETSEKRQIIPADDVYYFGLIFSNDGNSIYFVRRRQIKDYFSDIFRVSALGGTPEKIVESAQGWISLSPDDKKISFVRKENGANYSLFIADSDGKNEQKLATRKNPERIAANNFSPDGRSIVFAAGQSNDGTQSFRLFEFDLENKTETLFSDRSFFVINNFVWMPDGKDIVVSANSGYGKPHKLWKISGETGEAQKLSQDAGAYTDLSLDKLGKNLLVTQTKNSFELSFFHFKDTAAKKILASARSAEFITDEEIIFSTNEGDLWKINTDGTGQKQLTTGEFINHYPLISPDGKFIYFVSNRKNSNQIWRINTDGNNQIQITKKISGFPLFVEPDKKRLFFESTLYRNIWQASTDGVSQEKEAWDNRLLFASISDDGQKIAFLKNNESQNKQADIEIYNFEDKTLLQKIPLAEKGLRPVKLDWLADNETLFYITRDKTDNLLWQQKINGSPELIAKLGNNRISDFAVSPNGESFLIVSGEWLKDVILIEGFN